MGKPWPTHEIKIARGYDWTIKVKDPTMQQLMDIDTAYKSGEWQTIKNKTAPLFAEWDATNPAGEPLPLPTAEKPEPLDELPQVVIQDVMIGILGVFKGNSDPKVNGGDSSSLGTSPPNAEPQKTATETQA